MALLRASLLSLFFTIGMDAANSKVAEFVESQRQTAVPRTMYLPYYSVTPGHETKLYMVLKILDPLPVTVTAVAGGEQVLIGEYVVQPGRSTTLDLRQALGDQAQSLSSGILRLDYVGNAGTLQAWTVLRSGDQVLEVPFITSQKLDVPERVSFWDLALVGPGAQRRVEYNVTNTGATAAGVRVTIHSDRKTPRVESFTLSPYETRTLIVSDFETTPRGWLNLVTEPASGVVAAGLYRDDRQILAYSALTPRADAAPGPRLEIIRLPVDRNGRAEHATLAVFNTGVSSQKVKVEILSSGDGGVIGQRVLVLDAGQVRSLELKGLTGTPIRAGIRLRVTGDLPSLMVDGTSRAAAGEIMDMSVHAASTAHRSGTYPIPDLGSHDVRTTIVNLSAEPSEVAAQYFWDGGTFAVPLFTVPANGVVELDPKKLIAASVSDLAGRQLAPNARALTLKWSVWSGSQELIGRTESRPVTTADGFGFNCGGCCWQIPEVVIEPGEVDVAIGETPLFQALMFESTCSGRLGPWASSVTSSSVPYPFRWDYTRVSTEDGADEYITFETIAQQIDPMCLFSKEHLFAAGVAKACEKVFNPKGYDKAKTCETQTSGCTECKRCCTDLYNMKICQKYNKIYALNELNACNAACDVYVCS